MVKFSDKNYTDTFSTYLFVFIFIVFLRRNKIYGIFPNGKGDNPTIHINSQISLHSCHRVFILL